MKHARQDAKREASEAVRALAEGKAPATLISSSSKAVPLGAIKRVEVSHDHDTVKFHTVEGDKPVTVEFAVRSGDDGPGIARAVVERTAIKDPERSEDIGVIEALLAPVILGVLAGIAWVFVYFAAAALDSDEEINVNQGGRRGRGLKRLIVFIAEMLGMNGTIAVGAVLLAAFVGWAVLRIVKRPQRLVWGPPTT